MDVIVSDVNKIASDTEDRRLNIIGRFEPLTMLLVLSTSLLIPYY